MPNIHLFQIMCYALYHVDCFFIYVNNLIYLCNVVVFNGLVKMSDYSSLCPFFILLSASVCTGKKSKYMQNVGFKCKVLVNTLYMYMSYKYLHSHVENIWGQGIFE